MFIRRGITTRAILRDSKLPLIISFFWTSIIVTLHEAFGFEMIVVPTEPVATIGIVVSLYLGFKSTSAYQRWWEARMIWGEIVNHSRTWANSILMLVERDYNNSASIDTLVKRHVSWVIALAYQLRKVSKLEEDASDRIFDSRVTGLGDFHTAKIDHYEKFLPKLECEDYRTKANPAVHIIRKQGDVLRVMYEAKKLDNYAFASLSGILGNLYDCQGKCERIKNTPFPRQITVFGRLFTWIFIMLLPLAFIELFEREALAIGLTGFFKHEYVFMMIPFCMVISLIFYMLEKVSESCEDPFEWGMTDVPIATLARNIEIDLLQMIDLPDVPEPLKPTNGVMY
jgi:putative membrane protein